MLTFTAPWPEIWFVKDRYPVYLLKRPEMGQIEVLLDKEKATVLVGHEGIGKTFIAIHCAYYNRTRFDGVIFLHMDKLEEDCTLFLNDQNIPISSEGAIKSVMEWYSTTKKILLILDNVTPQLAEEFIAVTRRDNRLLLTSQDEINGARNIAVKDLDERTRALILVYRVLGPTKKLEDLDKEQQQRVLAISHRLGSNLSKIVEAGVYIDDHQCGFKGLLDLLESGKLTI